MMAPSSRRRGPLRGAAAQSVARRRAREDSRRSTRSSSSSSSETDFSTPAPPPANPRAIPAQGPALAPAPVPTDDLFRQFMQAYIEDRRQPAPAAAPVEPQEDVSDRPLKARNPDLYYSTSHMEFYYFCQQCKGHFKTAGAKGHKGVPFATTFLKDCILNYWQQHKAQTERTRADSLF